MRYPKAKDYAPCPESMLVCGECEAMVQRRRHYSPPSRSPKMHDSEEDCFRRFRFLKRELGQLLPRYRRLLQRSQLVQSDGLYWEADTTRRTMIHHLCSIKDLSRSIQSNDPESHRDGPDRRMLRQHLWLAMQLCVQRFLAPLQLFPALEDVMHSTTAVIMPPDAGVKEPSQDGCSVIDERKQNEEPETLGRVQRIVDAVNGRIRRSLQRIGSTVSEADGYGDHGPKKTEEKGVLLANARALICKLQVLREQELQLRRQLSSLNDGHGGEYADNDDRKAKDGAKEEQRLALLESLQDVLHEIHETERTLSSS
jgi:hypothetical protein